jgi:hypothetical protein
VVSVADRLRFGLVADPAVIQDLNVLAGAVELAATELLRAGEGLDVEPPADRPSTPVPVTELRRAGSDEVGRSGRHRRRSSVPSVRGETSPAGRFLPAHPLVRPHRGGVSGG